MNITDLKLKIGPYDCFAIPTGSFGLDGGAMFGTVPKVLWEKSNPPDEKNRIPMEARALLLKAQDRNVLIDCGNGSDFVAKYGEKMGTQFAAMYGVEAEGASLQKSLAACGLTTGDITDVILTHLHFDHAGGATRFDGQKIVPTFAKARYYVQRENFETASKPNRREKASYLPANFTPLLEAGVLTLLDGPVSNLMPGISLRLSYGHTCAHQVVEIRDDQKRLVYCGDLIPTSSHVRLAWVMGYDLNPLQLIEEKEALLTEVSQSEHYLFFEHDPYCDAAQVTAEKGDFKVTQRYRLTGAH